MTFSFSTVRGNNLISLLLYGNDKFDDTKNRQVFMSTITFTKDLQRFDEQLLWWSASVLKCRSFAVTLVMITLSLLFSFYWRKFCVLLFQRASFTLNFALGFFFLNYNFNFSTSPVCIKYISGRTSFSCFNFFSCTSK